jgi:hypothetical protein
MLGEVARRSDELAREVEREAQPPIAEVEVQLRDMFRLDPFLRPAPDLGGQHLDQVLGEAERLADIAQRTLRPVADDGRAQRGMIATIGVEHPLHDDLAPLVLEVDVNVRRLAPFLRDEALEQQIIAVGIDAGNAKHVADRRIGGRPAALAENVLRACEADDGIHCQKIRRVVELLDELQLVREGGPHCLGQTFGIALGRAFPGQSLQGLLRRQPRQGPLLGILIREFIESELAALSDLDRAGERLGIAAEQPVHFFRPLEEAVGVALATKAEFVDGAVVANGGDDILQDAPRWFVEQHVIGDDGRHPPLNRQVGQFMEPQLIVRPPAQGQR